MATSFLHSSREVYGYRSSSKFANTENNNKANKARLEGGRGSGAWIAGGGYRGFSSGFFCA